MSPIITTGSSWNLIIIPTIWLASYGPLIRFLFSDVPLKSTVKKYSYFVRPVKIDPMMGNLPCPSSIRHFFSWFLCISFDQQIFNEPFVIYKEVSSQLYSYCLEALLICLSVAKVFYDAVQLFLISHSSILKIYDLRMRLDAAIPIVNLDLQNSVFYMFSKICLALVYLTLLDIPRWWDVIFLVAASCTRTWLQEIELFFPSFVNSPTTYHPNGVLKANGPPSLCGSTSSGSYGFEHFPMRNPISILSSGNLSAMTFKWYHLIVFPELLPLF